MVAKSLARELAENLIGTCKTGVQVSELDEAQSAEFDALVFCCDGCAWWFSTEDLHNDTGEQLCPDCTLSDEDA